MACVWCHQEPHRIDVRAASAEEVDEFLKIHEVCEPDQHRRRPTWRGR